MDLLYAELSDSSSFSSLEFLPIFGRTLHFSTLLSSLAELFNRKAWTFRKLQIFFPHVKFQVQFPTLWNARNCLFKTCGYGSYTRSFIHLRIVSCQPFHHFFVCWHFLWNSSFFSICFYGVGEIAGRGLFGGILEEVDGGSIRGVV
jgi:hypothetical protein